MRQKEVFAMTATTATVSAKGTHDEGSCDVRIWSKECEHETFENIGDKYLCVTCATIPGLNHEVHRAAMPYVSGDYDNLS
jgi:hypothetical protein